MKLKHGLHEHAGWWWGRVLSVQGLQQNHCKLKNIICLYKNQQELAKNFYGH